MISQVCLILTRLMFLWGLGLDFSLLFFNTHSFVWLNYGLASLSVAKKALICLTCSCSSPWYCQQPCTHCLLACVHWVEWPHSRHSLSHSLFTFALTYAFFLLISLLGAVESMQMKCAHDVAPFHYVGLAHVLSTLISSSQLRHRIPHVSLPWRGTGDGQGNVLSSPAMFLWTRLSSLQGLADIIRFGALGSSCQCTKA